MLAVLFIIISILSSYLTIERSRDLVEELTGEVSAEARLCVNRPPAINQSCNTSATVGVGYYCDVDASDPDNDSVTFYDNTGLFDIDLNTGEIIFTPVSGDAGAYSILLTAVDDKGCSNSNATALLTITIPAPPAPPPGPGGGGGGGEAPVRECIPQWECGPWGPCEISGLRERTCYTLNNCPQGKPNELMRCIYVLPPAVRRPREVPENYLCNFDIVSECHAEFGAGEAWIYTYKNRNSTIDVMGVLVDGMDASVDDYILFSAPLRRIKPLDVTGDKVDDFEYIVHNIYGGKASTTVRLIRQVESVVERPVYIETLPYFIIIILMFVYANACIILLLLMLIAAILLYYLLMRRMNRDEEETEEKKRLNRGR
ncbi:Ig domain-containing protein [Nanoarchaeota archaeon]